MTDLLKVLDMSEEEQVEFFYIKGYRQLVDTFPVGGLRIKCNDSNEIISVKHSQSKLRFDKRALADLAFRLRDEVIVEQGTMAWFNALFDLNEYVGGSKKYTTPSMPFDEDRWLCYYGKPIHWIIAALIAKDKEND